jgi:hypothetical protein
MIVGYFLTKQRYVLWADLVLNGTLMAVMGTGLKLTRQFEVHPTISIHERSTCSITIIISLKIKSESPFNVDSIFEYPDIQ